MITTEYSVATPHGVFMAQWSDDEEIPVKYSGDGGAISYFKAFLDLNSISGPGGALVRFDALEPADLYGFCQSEKYGIFVAPTEDDIMDDMEQEQEGQKMITVLDAVSDAKAFELIGEGTQILSRLNEDSDTFFADIGTLREIIQQLGDDAPEQIIAAALTGTELGDFPDTPEGRVALRSAAKDYFAKLQGTKVFNASLNADIGFVREGIRKALSFSADPRKLKLIPALPKILASAVDAKKLPARGDDPDVVAMHVLKADVTVGDATLTVRVVVKERNNGSFFYDHSVNKGDLGGSTELLDSVDGTGLSLIALLCTEPSMQQVLMDSVSQSGEVFNLFIEGEALEELTTEAAPLADLDPTEPTGYAVVMTDAALQLKWQDKLDAFFQGRLVDVRNAMRELGWDGPNRGDLSKNGTKANFVFKTVGGGANLVAMTINGVADDLTKTPAELAAAVDATAPAEDAGKLTDKRAMMQDMLDSNPEHANAADLRAEIERINGIIGAPPAKEVPAPVERRIAGGGEPFYMQAIYDLDYKWKTATAENRMDGGFVGQMKRDIRTAAKKVPMSDEMAVTMIDLLATRVFGTDYDPKVADIEFALEPSPAPQPEQNDVSMQTLISIAANSIAELRRIDVYRVLDAAGERHKGSTLRSDLATYIATNRPDLVAEVTAVMAEEWPHLNWSLTTAAAPELLTPSDDGKPKQLDVPPVPEAGSAPEATPQRAADIAFLGDVIAHRVDMWADDLADKIEALGSTYAGDADVEKLWGEAISAYTDYMVAEMSKG